MSASSREKARARRERLRRLGLQPIRFWALDVRSPKFAAEAHRQSLIVARGAMAKEDQDWVDAVSAGAWDNE